MIVIKNGKIITASDTYTADILVDGETILQIGVELTAPEGALTIDASGKLVMPGGVDVHTHFDLPMFDTVSSDDHYSGHKAAAFGGTTTVIDFVPYNSISLQTSVDEWHIKADPKAAVDFGFHMNITDSSDQTLAEIPTLIREGITSLKVFTAYNNRMRLGDGSIFKVMRVAGENQMLTMLHAENGDVIEVLVGEAIAHGCVSPEWHAKTRPSWGAVESVLRAISLAAQADAPIYIVHMNAAGEVDQLEYGLERGICVIGETCPQYLLLSEDRLSLPDGAKYICSPPLRQRSDNAALWRGISKGTITVIGTDHCSFFYNGRQPIDFEGIPVAIPGKELGESDFSKIPNGLPGVGDRLPILWTSGVNSGRISPNQFVALNSTNPAKIFGLYPRKGCLIPGADADIVIWDPEKKITYGVAHSQHRTDYNLYEGWELVGFPEKVFLRGRLIVNEGQWFGRQGMGKFIKRGLFQQVNQG